MFQTLFRRRIQIAWSLGVFFELWAHSVVRGPLLQLGGRILILSCLYWWYSQGAWLPRWILVGLLLITLIMAVKVALDTPGKGPNLVLPVTILFGQIICLLLTPPQSAVSVRESTYSYPA